MTAMLAPATIHLPETVTGGIAKHAAPYSHLCTDPQTAESVFAAVEYGTIDTDELVLVIDLLDEITDRLAPQMSAGYWSKMGDSHAGVVAQARCDDHAGVVAAAIALLDL